jgi:broad specificity polyphosphatase/5'/3'-nucleotidase SurE
MHILVTNDAGINAPGLLALNQALKMMTRMGLRIYYDEPVRRRAGGRHRPVGSGEQLCLCDVAEA